MGWNPQMNECLTVFKNLLYLKASWPIVLLLGLNLVALLQVITYIHSIQHTASFHFVWGCCLAMFVFSPTSSNTAFEIHWSFGLLPGQAVLFMLLAAVLIIDHAPLCLITFVGCHYPSVSWYHTWCFLLVGPLSIISSWLLLVCDEDWFAHRMFCSLSLFKLLLRLLW